MSGDVFGNAMLLSRHIRLVAAFDHRHIFLDPSAPTGADAEAAFNERARLFALPRSSWDDYNKDLLGNGGGIYPRTLKEIPLSPDVQALIGSDATALAPAALINALLKAQVDLLWFGGIGTYIKSAAQSNLEVGDRANDGLRVDGGEVRAKVVGEGANLGVTQLGRIEYARGGGRIDTDAVDNSAGVDTSDHEVNIKILLAGPVARGEMTGQARVTLLAAMTDDVAALVLADNYDQTLALSVTEANATRDADAAARFIRDLEARGKLDRAVEFLPSDAALRALAHEGKGLTRPELAVLLAYAKLDLDAEILASGLPDDPAFLPLLTGYFPKPAVDALPAEPQRHRLKREIVSTALANRIVNLAGPLFVMRMRELSGADGAEVARAFAIADGAFGLSALKRRIDALDGKVEAAAQTRAYGEIALHLRRVTPWFLAHAKAEADLAATTALYRAGVEALRSGLDPDDEDKARFTEFGMARMPEDLATDLGLLPRLSAASDVVLLAHDAGRDAGAVAALYFVLGAKLGLDRLRMLAAKLTPGRSLGPAGAAPAAGRSVGDPARHRGRSAGRRKGYRWGGGALGRVACPGIGAGTGFPGRDGSGGRPVDRQADAGQQPDTEPGLAALQRYSMQAIITVIQANDPKDSRNSRVRPTGHLSSSQFWPSGSREAGSGEVSGKNIDPSQRDRSARLSNRALFVRKKATIRFWDNCTILRQLQAHFPGC